MLPFHAAMDVNQSGSPAEPTREIDDQGDRQNQANPAAADRGSSKIIPASPEQQKKDDQKD